MVFKSSKDTTVCIGHITNINLFQIDCIQYQESINLLMEGSAQEKMATNKKHFELFNTTAEFAKYDIQLWLGKPNVWYKGKKIETDTLRVYARLKYSNLALDSIQDILGLIATKSVEQNAYLCNYADF
eukprot:15365516-Ditylum_brightwellii.AAC.2